MTWGPVFAAFVVAFALTSCLGESAEEAYQRGYHDGWADTCNDIRRFSATLEQTLTAERIC